jgi:bisphosphoglycerate-independent phosphoglycerate mutase (AlkP superfamily)
MTASDLQAKRAMSADFTGVGWAAQPDFPPAPIYTPQQAGALLADLSLEYQFAWFDYWPTDYIGHRGTIDQAVNLLQSFDAILGGLIDAWSTREDLVIITSDHGNLEDLSQRGHTLNRVPMIAIGPRLLREKFTAEIQDLTDFVPVILKAVFNPQSPD